MQFWSLIRVVSKGTQIEFRLMLNSEIFKSVNRFSECSRMLLLLPSHRNPCWSPHLFHSVGNERDGQARPDNLLPELPFAGLGGWLEGWVTRGLWNWLLSINFSPRRSVNDPFHLLPSTFGIRLHHWVLLLLGGFYNQSQGERKVMACRFAALPASVCRDSSLRPN